MTGIHCANLSPTFEHIGQFVLEEDEPGELVEAVLLGGGLGVVNLDEVDAGDVAVVVDNNCCKNKLSTSAQKPYNTGKVVVGDKQAGVP